MTSFSSIGQKRNSKLQFKRHLGKLVKDIQDHHLNLFQQSAFRKHMQQGVLSVRKNRCLKRPKFGTNGLTLSQGSDQSVQSRTYQFVGQGTSNSLIYENEPFFETQNDNLIEIKNIFESRLFWDRINTFFDIKVSSDEIIALNDFYKVNH